jgi:S-DNA-T family DNA segregation ATPase FtsK/SpoIIIE
MLHKPDAAYITQAGRCYLQVGNDELYELFQSGYSGATYDENAGSWKSNIASMVSLTGKAALIGGNLKRKQQSELRRTWICNLIQIMQQSAADRGMTMESFANAPEHMKTIYKRLEYFDVEYPDNDYNSRRLEELLQIYNAMVRLMSEEGKEPSLDEIVQELLKYVDENNVKLPEQKMKTQLDAMVEYLAKVAKENGYNHKFQLWMPLLPTALPLTNLTGYEEHIFDGTRWPEHQGEWSIETQLGLCDDPVSQAQMPLILSFSENGHHAILGMIVSGKSTLLQTLLYALIHKYTPDYLNIYAIDFSSHMLSAFEHAPHVGGVMYEDDAEKIDKFFHMMDEILEERKKLFKGGNYSQYVRANGVRIPAIIIAIDNYGSFREKTENKYDEAMIHLSHDGVSYGIFLIMTAGGFGSSEIQTKVGDNIKTTIALQMNDKFQYADAMRVTRVDTLPESDIKGRGLAKIGERILEFQTALALEAEDDYQRMEKIEEICKKMQHVWTGKRAKMIPVIPEKPIWSEYEELSDVETMFNDDRHLPIGYDLESAASYGIDLSKTYCYMISGRARTGKTNALKALIRSAARRPGKVVIIEHNSDELQATAAKVEAQYINNQTDQAEFFKNLLEPIKKRNAMKKEWMAEGDEDLIYTNMQAEDPVYIFISDMGPFLQTIYKPEEGVVVIRPFLENITEKGKQLNIYFFVGLNPDQTSTMLGQRVYENMVGYHAGMHLGGCVSSLRYMDFSYMSYTEQGKTQKMGIALLPTGNEDTVTKVVIPLVKG